MLRSKGIYERTQTVFGPTRAYLDQLLEALDWAFSDCMWAGVSRLRRDVVYGRITTEKGWCFTGGGKWNCQRGMNELYSFSFVTQGIIKIDG